MSTTMLNLYMIFGGTNWGTLTSSPLMVKFDHELLLQVVSRIQVSTPHTTMYDPSSFSSCHNQLKIVRVLRLQKTARSERNTTN